MCVCLLYADARCWDAVSFLSASLTARMLIITAPTVSRHWRMCPDSSDNVTAESAIHYILQQWILNICGSVSISCLYQWERSDSYSITVSSCSFLAHFVWCHCCYCSCVCLSVCLFVCLSHSWTLSKQFKIQIHGLHIQWSFRFLWPKFMVVDSRAQFTVDVGIKMAHPPI